MEALLASGNLRIVNLYDAIRVRYVDEPELRQIDPDLRSFFNVNTPEDWQRALADLVGCWTEIPADLHKKSPCTGNRAHGHFSCGDLVAFVPRNPLASAAGPVGDDIRRQHQTKPEPVPPDNAAR